MNKEKDYLKMAFLGCGAFSRYHLDGVDSLDEKVKITAAIDINLANATVIAEKTGAAGFDHCECG